MIWKPSTSQCVPRSITSVTVNLDIASNGEKLGSAAALKQTSCPISGGEKRLCIWTAISIRSACVALLFILTACTVTPQLVKPSTISFSGTNQNSGIIAATNGGWIIDAGKRDRYNALISDYGNEFRPVLKPDAGLSPLPHGYWLIDDEHIVYLLDMAQWRRSKPR